MIRTNAAGPSNRAEVVQKFRFLFRIVPAEAALDLIAELDVPEQLARLVYRSQPLLPLASNRAVADIFRVAVQRNSACGVTGALLFTPDRFVQVLEGPTSDLADLMNRLRNDPRHRSIEVIAQLPVRDRLFIGLPMARAEAEQASALAYKLLSHTGTGAQVTSLLLGVTTGAERGFSC